MNVLGIIFLSVAIVNILVWIYVAIAKHDPIYVLWSLMSIIIFMMFAVVNWPDPKDDDVQEGKAIYVKEHHIGVDSNGDTIYNYDTYKLQWKPEWKYGRQH